MRRGPDRSGIRARSLPDEGGFTLIGLMIVVAIINIGLGVAATSWVTIDKRADEAELIWRGQQYVRALACHRDQTGGLPQELDELLESDCIRALYPDPMTSSGAWRVIRESDLREEAGARRAGGGRSAAQLLDDIDREVRGPEAFFESGGGRGGRGGAVGPGGQGTDLTSESLQTAFERLRNLTDRLRQDFATTGDGIVGVVSTSTDEALRLYRGESTYDAWRFLVQ